MIYRIIAIVIIASFYTFYFAKLVILKKQSIKTNQMGIGNKPKKVIIIEKIMQVATVLTCVVGVLSVIFAKVVPFFSVRIAGMICGVFGVVFFAMASITMKNSWRVGIPEEKTSLVTSGIYKWSRNPAFVGFYLLYFSTCLMFFNIPLMVVSLWAALMLHLQILQEEQHMIKVCGSAYEEYKRHTFRYFGRR